MVTCLVPIGTFVFGDRVSSRFPLSVWNVWRLYVCIVFPSDNPNSSLLAVVVHTCIPALLKAEKEACHEFKASLDFIVSSRPVWAKDRERTEKGREGRDPSQVRNRNGRATVSALWKGREPRMPPAFTLSGLLLLSCACPVPRPLPSVWLYLCGHTPAH